MVIDQMHKWKNMVFCNEKFIDVADGRKNDYIRV